MKHWSSVWLLACYSTAAQAKFKIGIAAWTGYPENVGGFKQGLSDSGLVDGENLEVVIRASGGDANTQNEIARDFSSFDLVYSLTTVGTQIVKDVVPENLPVVFSIVTYPADVGLIESMAFSSNNLLGTSNFVPLEKYVEIVQNILPHTKRIAIFHRKDEVNSTIQAFNMKRLFDAVGIEVIDLTPTTIDEMKEMASEVSNSVDVFMTTTDTLCQSGGEDAIIPISISSNTPILSSNLAGIKKGYAFGPVANFYNLGYEAGKMASKILQTSVRPSHLESSYQEIPDYFVNRNTMKKMGFDINETQQHSLSIQFNSSTESGSGNVTRI
ncbi:hypothetical protein CS022_04770 [Veronia nyctiphanis]|uniref:ABC transporter substrate-binding protein n=1 Tax=Veronia nyctiphanis TaxID=1278244 RepID=A0A4Q0YZ21_9GAMM|nr:ABC transporter substrate-binding protein [Veronia nyctiphanis]RXJ74361.1 hypothetical protein CS022_04770 [Veronia nyctiphanis]